MIFKILKSLLIGSVFILTLNPDLYGQELATLKGRLLDDSTGEPVVGATVSLVQVSDTTITFEMGSDQKGNFLFDNLSPAFYKLIYTSIGYEPGKKYVRVQSPVTDIGSLKVTPDITELKEVKVIGKAISVETKGDTTSIDADGFKTNPDANVEDLIAKMPGIVINGSGVQAQGENVQKVLVDGREFFANDPSIALKNIPAEIVQKIEIFDQLSEQAQFSGFDDGNTTKTLNIVTRIENRKGDFGRVYAGANLDNQFKTGGNFNHFDDTLRLSVVGMSNNINQQNFSAEDLVGISSASAGRGGRGGFGAGQGSSRGGSSTFQTAGQPGISESHAYGLNYSNEWKSIRLTGSYFFNAVDNTNEQILNRENFVPNGENQLYQEASSTFTKNYNNRVNARLIYTIDDRNSIIFIPNLSWQNSRQTEWLDGKTSLSSGELLNITNNNFSSTNSGYNLGGSALYRLRFDKRGRTLSLRISGKESDNSGDADLDNISQFGTAAVNDTILQYISLESPSSTYNGSINFTEPISQWGQLQLGYRNSFNFSNSDRRTFDGLDSEELLLPLDTALSNVFDSRYETHSPNLGLMLRKDKLMMRLGMAYQLAYLDSEQTFPREGNINRSFNSWLPTAMLRFRISSESNIRMFYRSYTQNPSIEQLQNVVDNSNPLFLTTGNPELDQSTNHMIVARYSSVNPKNASSFFGLASIRTIDDYITNATFIASEDTVINSDLRLRQGGQLSSPINIDGYLNSRILFTYGIPSTFLKSNLNFTLGTSYVRMPGKVNTTINTSHTITYNAGVVVASNISENLDYTLMYELGFNDVKNDVESNLSNEYSSHNATAKLNWIFPGGFVFRSFLSYQYYKGFTDGFKDTYTLWNLSLAKKFLSEKRGELALSVFDLLKENTSLNRVNTESYIEEIQTNVLQQYFMLTFTYTFNNFKGFADRPEQNDRFRQGQGQGGRRW